MACAALLLTMSAARAQFADCSTGLLQMPTADMQPDGTVMITNNYLNKNALPRSGWNYDTFQYGIYVSFWNRVEIGYVCTIFNGKWDPRPNKTYRQTIMRNQDRHFTGRVALLREGDFGVSWLPALVVGISDPTTGAGGGEYLEADVTKGNGFFNRNFVVLTKHFATPWGTLGAHAGYQFNRRKDYRLNAPCVGVNWQPVWLQHQGILDRLDLIAEYDARTVNLGLTASVWHDHFEAMFELQNFRWVNFGLRFKFRVKK
ncbi:Exopolysaccharide biosynthesis protein YbjH [Bacteroidales bacterium WCE2004]|nr:Exopolysaccharide biosynthesis protein YbjH [Bacteroidales bacterium WCE2004]